MEINPSTGEPFLRLKKHKNIILTPPRLSDITSYPPILNDPRVHKWLIGPPFPYLPEHAEAWYKIIKVDSDKGLAELNAARSVEGLVTIGDCPIRAIRVKENGDDIYLGDLCISRCSDGRLLAPAGLQLDDSQKEHLEDLNVGRKVGDPDIIWTIGDYLAPSHHGQGIMTDALDTLLSEWAIPRMGVRRIIATALEGNRGSVRVFEKCGFVLTRNLERFSEVRGIHNAHVLEWNWNNNRN